MTGKTTINTRDTKNCERTPFTVICQQFKQLRMYKFLETFNLPRLNQKDN